MKKGVTRIAMSAFVCSVICAAVAACHERDLEQPWGLSESRVLRAGPAAQGPPLENGWSIAVPVGLPRDELALAASEALFIGEGASVSQGTREKSRRFATVSSFGDMILGPRAEVGSIYALGCALKLAPDAVVHGSLTAQQASLDAPMVQGGIRLSSPTDAEEFRWDVPTIGGGSSVLVSDGWDSPRDLPPAAYEGLHIVSGAAGRLRTGTYFVGSLEVEPNGRLELDNTTGPIFIWVRNVLKQDGQMLDYSLRANVMMGYGGTEPVTIDSPLRATLVAPRASVTLSAVGIPHSGAVFARRIVLDTGATFEHRSFVGPGAVPYADTQTACGRCSLAAMDFVRQCAVASDRALAIAGERRDDCLTACGADLNGLGERAEAPDCATRCADGSAFRDSAIALDRCRQASSGSYEACVLNYALRVDSCSRLSASRASETMLGEIDHASGTH